MAGRRAMWLELVPDYQMSAFSMAVYFKGMTKREISDLTMNMVKTGQEFDLSAIEGLRLTSIRLWCR